MLDSNIDKQVLVLFYSRHGSVANLAEEIAQGVNSVAGISAKLRSVPSIASSGTHSQDEPTDGPIDCELDDLRNCDGLIMGSPTRFGNMAAPLKHFLDGSSALWASGDLIDKPAAVFTSSSSMHGGNESTLLSMMLPLMHHGMLIMGVPYTNPALGKTQNGGTPYGASHVEMGRGNVLDQHEVQIARQLGERMAKLLKAIG